MLIKLLRNGLGRVIIFFDWITRGKPVTRSESAQQAAQAAVADHSLYQLYACPFCVKTRRAIHRLNVDVELRDINKNHHFREQLNYGGGRVKVPCLRIENGDSVQWMYESNDIINYLEQRVA